jgi:polysaccharide export outer membrane protein
MAIVPFTLVVGCCLAVSTDLPGADAHAPAPAAAVSEPVVAKPKSPAPSATSPMVAVPATDIHGYALYPGDLIAIDVFDQPGLSVVVRIPPSGGIRFPLLGEIAPVVGREVNDFGDELKRRLEADYLQQATLTITVREFAKRRAYVMGSIAHPDALDLDPFSHTTALGAIGQAGGFLDEANRDSVMVMRDGPAGRVSFLISAGSQGHAPRDMVLLPNDIVVVPHLERIYVMGLVTHPGAVNLPFAHNTALRAIGDAGGFLDEANRDAVIVVRESSTGGASVTIPMGPMGRGLTDVVLQPNDTVIVPRLDRVYIIGQVNHPGAVSLPSQEALTVSKAVSLAGGFDHYAREGNVQLLRTGVPVQTIDVAAILTGDTSKDDPRLSPGDTVFVPQRRY